MILSQSCAPCSALKRWSSCTPGRPNSVVTPYFFSAATTASPPVIDDAVDERATDASCTSVPIIRLLAVELAAECLPGEPALVLFGDELVRRALQHRFRRHGKRRAA